MVEHSLLTQEPDVEQLITDPQALRVYFDATRTRILRTMVGQPRTVHEIADELKVPFTRLYYHINMLEKHHLIRVVDVRSLSGAVEEKYYRVTAYRFVIDRDLLTMRAEESDNVLSQITESVLLKTHRDISRSARNGLIDVTESAPHPNALLAQRTSVRLSTKRAQEFQERLQTLIAEFSHDPTSADSVRYAVALAVYPTIDDEASAIT